MRCAQLWHRQHDRPSEFAHGKCVIERLGALAGTVGRTGESQLHPVQECRRETAVLGLPLTKALPLERR